MPKQRKDMMRKSKGWMERERFSRRRRRNVGRTSMPPRLNERPWAQGELRLRCRSLAPGDGPLVSEVPKG